MSSYHSVLVKTCACIAAASLLFAGCNKKSTPAPSPPAQVANVSGDYSGTLNDSVSGSNTAAGTLSQHGASAGGGIDLTSGAGSMTAQFSIVVTTSNSYTGSIVMNQPGGPACTFSTQGTYANDGSTSASLTGSYTAVSNCAGENGTYALTQQCSDVPTVLQSGARRMTYPAHC